MKKFYYRNVEINTSDTSSNSENTKNVVLNAYMPGMWNTVITDFVVTVILSLIVFMKVIKFIYILQYVLI